MKLRSFHTCCGLGIALAAFACKADLKPECVGGDGTCDEHQIATTTTSEGGSGGGQGGMGGDPLADCYATCDLMDDTATGEYPCDVLDVVANCQRCHSAPLLTMSGAPFPLDTYADMHQLYPATATGISIYGRLKTVLIDSFDFMPFDSMKLSQEEKEIILHNWGCVCAPPRPMGEMCP